jgi:hypothetical protein
VLKFLHYHLSAKSLRLAPQPGSSDETDGTL